MAEKKKFGSKLYRVLVALWLATTLLLLGLLFPIGSSAAKQIEVDTEQRSLDYNSAMYSNILWSAVETRVTESDVRSCYTERTCQDVVVVDSLVSNVGDTVSVIDIADLNLRIKDGSLSSAVRFDCAGKLLNTMDPLLGVGCVERGSRVNLEPGETVAVSLLFEVDPSNNLVASELSLEILEAHRSTTQPATLSLGAVVVPQRYPINGVVASSRSIFSDETELRLSSVSQVLDTGFDRVAVSDIFVVVVFDVAGVEVNDFNSTDFELAVGSEVYEVDQFRTIGESQVQVVFELPEFQGLATVNVDNSNLEGSFNVVLRGS